MPKISFFKNKAREVRKLLLTAAFKGRSAHIGSALSTVDVIVALYFGILNINPKKSKDPKRDIFILSKGHGCLGLYATLALKAYFSKNILLKYFKDGTTLAGHPVLNAQPGIESSTGSLGHGFPTAVGLAYGFKKQKRLNRVVTMISDGECDEGATWEAALAAPNFKLNNLTLVVDYNKIQSFGTVKEVMDLEPLVKKWQDFGWNVIEINGHDFRQILAAFKRAKAHKSGPTAIIAHTIKGKGVSFMENTLEWHYFNLDEAKLSKALAEL